MRRHAGARMVRRTAACLAIGGTIAAGVSCARREVVLLLTADTEGSVRACSSCSTPGGLGDLARRATAISDIRRAAGPVLVADAGNVFIGNDSIESGGRVIVAAYEAIGYDAVNLTYRDFRLGRSATVGLVGTAHFPIVSANLEDESSRRLIAAPFVVRRAGALRVAFVGVTELPVGVAALEHIREQLAGVRVRAPVEALAEWLPKARAESDLVVLLYYGSADGLGAVGRASERQLAAILVGGLRPGDLPERATTPLAASTARGTEITRIDLPFGGPARLTRLPIDGRYRPDPRMLEVLKVFDGGRMRPVM